jgi:hypothetical protein
MNNGRKITADQARALPGAPRFLRGESEESFWKLFEAIADEYKPEGVSEWLDIYQYAIKHWEQDRLQRCSSVLVENGLPSALRDLLRPFYNANMVNGIPEKIARNYYSNHEADRAEAEKQVRKCGITDEKIMAVAIEGRAKAIVLLDRMDNHRAGAKRNLRKELDRRLGGRRNSSDQPPSQ